MKWDMELVKIAGGASQAELMQDLQTLQLKD
jgi:hypothetical protein